MDGRAWVMIGIWIIVGTLYVLVMRNYNKRKREHDQC
jgi:heme/copper-type cytochrome/quinol oxidase subunit 2